jgi:hypothetical protein
VRITLVMTIIALCSALVMLSGEPTFSADVDVGGIGFEVNLGFAGYFRPRSWVPLQITVVNEGVPFSADVEVVTTLGTSFTAMPGRVMYRRPLVMPTGTKKRLLINLPISNTQRPLDVRLVEANGNVLRSQQISLIGAGVSADIILVLDETGERWTWLQDVAQQTQGYMNRVRVHVAHIRSAPELPSDWVAYESIRTIILTDNYPIIQLSSEQIDALLRWIQTGGHLLVVGGSAQNLAQVPQLADILPVKLGTGSRIVTIERLGLGLSPFPEPYRTVVWNAAPGSGKVDYALSDIPLQAHQWVGAGRVTYLGFDLAAQPLRHWVGLDYYSRNLVFPQRMVRRGTGSLESSLLPLISTQRIPYPSHFTVILFAISYIAAVAGSLQLTTTRPLGWLLFGGSVVIAVIYTQVVMQPQIERSLRGYGEIRITQVPPESGEAYSFALAQMVNMRDDNWTIAQVPGVYIAPAGTNQIEANSLLVVEQNDNQVTIGPVTARRPLAITSQSLDHLPVQVTITREGTNYRLKVMNNTPWIIRHAFYVDEDRYVSLGAMEPNKTSEVVFAADQFIISSATLSSNWIAASVATVARNQGPDTRKWALQALEQIVDYALTPSNDRNDLPWGHPIIVAMIDTPVSQALTDSYTSVGLHFIVIPLSSLI